MYYLQSYAVVVIAQQGKISMSFTKIKNSADHFAKERVTNRVAVHTTGATRAKPNLVTAVRFSISGDVFAKIGSPTYAQLMVGTDEHQGKVLIRGAHAKTSDTFKLTNGGGQKSKSHQRGFSVGRQRLGVDKVRLPITPCEFEITDGGLVVTLPEELTNPSRDVLAWGRLGAKRSGRPAGR